MIVNWIRSQKVWGTIDRNKYHTYDTYLPNLTVQKDRETTLVIEDTILEQA